MLSFSISYPDSIKFPSFADLTHREGKRGWKEAQRQGDFKENYVLCVLKIRWLGDSLEW